MQQSDQELSRRRNHQKESGHLQEILLDATGEHPSGSVVGSLASGTQISTISVEARHVT